MSARLLALGAVLAVALAGAPPADAVAAEKARRAPACKTKKASEKTAGQPRRKRRCRPQARHLRKPAAKRSKPAPIAPSLPTALPGVPTVAAPPAVLPSQPAPAVDPTCGPSHNIGATAEDLDGFRLRLTRTCVPAGVLTVNYRNTDSSDHDLWAVPLAVAGEEQQVIVRTPTTDDVPLYGTATVTPGRWELLCSLSGHGAMRATVTVTP